MLECAVVETVAVACIPVGQDHAVVRVEDFPDFLTLEFEDDHHEAAHEEATVGLLVVSVTAVVVELDVLVVWIHEESHELPDELVHLS